MMRHLAIGTRFRAQIPRREMTVEIEVQGEPTPDGYQRIHIWLDHDRDQSGPGIRALAPVPDLIRWHEGRIRGKRG